VQGTTHRHGTTYARAVAVRTQKLISRPAVGNLNF